MLGARSTSISNRGRGRHRLTAPGETTAFKMCTTSIETRRGIPLVADPSQCNFTPEKPEPPTKTPEQLEEEETQEKKQEEEAAQGAPHTGGQGRVTRPLPASSGFTKPRTHHNIQRSACSAPLQRPRPGLQQLHQHTNKHLHLQGTTPPMTKALTPSTSTTVSQPHLLSSVPSQGPRAPPPLPSWVSSGRV